jgi:hypothetical protein
MGDSRVARCLQGGGFYVQDGTVSIVNSQIYSNTASKVRASHACKLPIAPMGKLLKCLPRLTLAQLQTHRSTTVGTCHRDLANFPSPPWETHVCSLFAGWRCQCRGRHSGHLIVHHQREHSCLGARSCSKLPIAPMGKVLTCLHQLSLVHHHQWENC